MGISDLAISSSGTWWQSSRDYADSLRSDSPPPTHPQLTFKQIEEERRREEKRKLLVDQRQTIIAVDDLFDQYVLLFNCMYTTKESGDLIDVEELHQKMFDIETRINKIQSKDK